MKSTQQIKKLLKRLEELKEDFDLELESMIEDRNLMFENRSEKWQGSEKAEEFEDLTCELDDFKFELDELFSETQTHIDGLKDLGQ